MQIRKKKAADRKRIVTLLTAGMVTVTLSGCNEGIGLISDWDAEPEYETATEIEDAGAKPEWAKPVTMEQYADEAAIAHARQNGSTKEMIWLIDYCVNKVEPQAVEMLLRIPVFQKAAEENLISRYVTFGLTFDDSNYFAAMSQTCYHDKNGAQITDEENPGSYYNIGHRFLVNTEIFDEETQKDPEKRKELQDTFLHEMTHAFMIDYVRNGMTGTLKDGTWGPDGSRFPTWFIEGTAISVQNGYADTRSEFLELFALAEDATKEERLEIFGSPKEMYDQLSYVGDAVLEADPERYEQWFGGSENRISDIAVDYNVYSVSYYGAMFTYYMAAKSMGLDPFDGNDTIDMEAMRQGFGLILDLLHDGYSFDEILSEISKDPETGISAYRDCADFEEKFTYSPTDPGMIFLQKFVYDFESRITDSSVYIPGGSLVPGIDNDVEGFMDEAYHEAPSCYEIIYYPAATPQQEWYAISSVRPSDIALGGNTHRSYNKETLSETEAMQRDALHVGDAIVLVDACVSEWYQSPDEWLRLPDTEETEDEEFIPTDNG